jgi:hypothetical protein
MFFLMFFLMGFDLRSVETHLPQDAAFDHLAFFW